MIAVILMVCVAAGIAYPFAKQRFWPTPVEATDEQIFTARAEAAQSREQLCPTCSHLNPAGRRICTECGGPMPVTKAAQFWDGAQNDDMIREGIQAGGLLLGMVVAMLLANFLPVAGKSVILIVTIAALGYRFMRTVYN